MTRNPQRRAVGPAGRAPAQPRESRRSAGPVTALSPETGGRQDRPPQTRPDQLVFTATHNPGGNNDPAASHRKRRRPIQANDR